MRRIKWTLVAPATLWSSQVLKVRGDDPVNDFAANTAIAFMRRCGVSVDVTTRTEQGLQITHEFRWPGNLLL